jgi:hypothetical protein
MGILSTLHKISPAGIPKPPIAVLAKVARAVTMATPAGLAVGLASAAVVAVATHPDAVKSTLAKIGSEVKKDVGAAASTVGHAAVVVGKEVKKDVGAMGNAMMMPLMIGGALVVAFMLLKR